MLRDKNYEELDLEYLEDSQDLNYSFALRGTARELIPSEILAEEFYSRGQVDLDTILEKL